MITAIALLIAHSVVARPLPSMPEPKPIVQAPKPALHGQFYSGKLTRYTLLAEGAAWSADMAYTCNNLSPHHGLRGHEDWLPANTCGQVLAITAGFHVAGEGLAYLLHRSGHHKLEQVPRWYLTFGNAAGAVYSSRKGWR
jgi:hypothetical protein